MNNYAAFLRVFVQLFLLVFFFILQEHVLKTGPVAIAP